MKLVSRDCIEMSWCDVLSQIFKAAEENNKKRLTYFGGLHQMLLYSSKKFGKGKNIYLDINVPSFQSLGFNISEMEITRETILNSFVIASYEENYIMGEKIKPYLEKNSYLYGEIEKDVREYILDNSTSIEEYLGVQDEMTIFDGEDNESSNKVYTKTQNQSDIQ